MSQRRVKFTLKGPHKGKDFTPKFAPQFAFKKGVCEVIIEDSEIANVAHLLSSYGATHKVIVDEALEAAEVKEAAKLEANDAAIAKAQAFEQDEKDVKVEIQKAKTKGKRDGNKTAKTKGKRDGNKTAKTAPAKPKPAAKNNAGNAAAKAGDAKVQPSSEADLI